MPANVALKGRTGGQGSCRAWRCWSPLGTKEAPSGHRANVRRDGLGGATVELHVAALPGLMRGRHGGVDGVGDVEPWKRQEHAREVAVGAGGLERPGLLGGV